MKKILSLLALSCLGMGAWAQTVVTTPKVSTTETQYRYKLHCKATDHNSYLGIVDGNFNGRSAEANATEFEFEAGQADGQYYLRSVELGYVNASGGNITFAETPSTYWTINVGDGWVYLLANGVDKVYLNNNKTNGDGIKTANGTGDCSHWVLTEYQTNAEPLTWSEVKDGYTYAIVNVQPAAVGKNYYMNSTDGVLTPTDATGCNSLTKWPTTAQYVAEKQTNGKYAFKNVANGRYLAYKSHNTGENDKAGFYATVEAWSSWTMNKSTRSGYEGTYYPVCDNRNSATVKASTLLVTNNGGWNAWGDTECTDTGYSNNYGFVELAAPTMPSVDFNYVLQYETYTKNVPARGRVGDALPSVAIPNLFNATQPTGVIAADQQDVTIDLTLKDGIMPFEYFEQSSAITQWYTLRMRDNYWVKYSATGDVRFPLSTTEPAASDNSRLFAFVGNPLLGFKIISYAEGDYKSVTATTGNNSNCGAADGEADGTVLLFEVNDGHAVFHVDGDAYLNAIGGSTKLGVWNNGGAKTDGGSTFTFAEAEVATFDLDTYKAEAIAALPTNNPALYSAADLATATATINAVSCTSDAASIDAAKAAIKAAQVAYMKAPESKKVAFKSLASYSTRGADYYLVAEDAGTQMTSNESLTKKAVYTLTYNEDAEAYTVKALHNNTYLPKTGNYSTDIATTADVANAGFFTIVSAGTADQRSKVTCTNGEGGNLDYWRGIHLDNSKKIVVWGSNSAASQWNVEAVTDEQWESLNNVFDFTPEEGKTYTLKLKGTELYVNVKDTDTPKDVVLGTAYEGFRFTATTGGYHIQNASDNYIGGYANDWNMNSKTPEVWTIEPAEGGILLSCEKGHLGLDGTTEGSAFYRDKSGHILLVEECVAPDWTALSENLEEAYRYNIGTELGQYNAPGFYDVLSAAWQMNEAKTAADDKVADKVTELRAAIATLALNMPKHGQLLRIKSSGNWLSTPSYLAGQEKEGHEGRLEFLQPDSFDDWAEDNTIWVYYDKGDEHYLVNYANGLTAANKSSFMGLGMYPSTTKVEFLPAANSTIGMYNIRFASNRYLFANTNLYTDAANGTDTREGYNFELEDATTYFQLSYSDKGWASGYFPIDVAANPEYGIEAAYLINTDPENGYFTAQQLEGTIPAFTPVILKVRTDESFRPFVKGAPNFDSTPLPSVLTGALWKQKTPDNCLVFNVNNDQPGFYGYNGETLKHMKAYYVAPTAGQSVLRIKFGEEDTLTGIIEAIEKEEFSGAIYDLQGRRVNGVQNGVFVKNGKKVIK